MEHKVYSKTTESVQSVQSKIGQNNYVPLTMKLFGTNTYHTAWFKTELHLRNRYSDTENKKILRKLLDLIYISCHLAKYENIINLHVHLLDTRKEISFADIPLGCHVLCCAVVSSFVAYLVSVSLM